MLVLRPGALGDTLLAVPALRALRRAFSPITLAAHPGAARLLAAVGEVDRGMAFDDPSLGWVFSRDSVPAEAVVAWMSAEAAPALRHAAVVAPSRPPLMNRHCGRYLLETLGALGISLEWDDRPLKVSPSVSDEILVHPGSGSAVKNWPAERFAATLRALQVPVRVVVGEADGQAVDRLEHELGRHLPRLDHPPLEDLARRLAGCRAYLGNDSGVSHLAGLCGTHTVAMFGPTPPEVWRPIGPDVHVLPFDTDPHEVADLLRSSPAVM